MVSVLFTLMLVSQATSVALSHAAVDAVLLATGTTSLGRVIKDFLLFVVFLVCIWPLIFGVIGFFIGRSGRR